MYNAPTNASNLQPEPLEEYSCKRVLLGIMVTVAVAALLLAGVGLYINYFDHSVASVKWPREMPAAPLSAVTAADAEKAIIKELQQLYRSRTQMPKEYMCSTEPREGFLPFKAKFPSKGEAQVIYCPPTFSPTSVWWAAKNANEDVHNNWVEAADTVGRTFKFSKFEKVTTSVNPSIYRLVVWYQYQQYQKVPGTAGIPSAPEPSENGNESALFKQEYDKWCAWAEAAYEKSEKTSTAVLDVILDDNTIKKSVQVKVHAPITNQFVFHVVRKEFPDFAKEPFFVEKYDKYIAARLCKQDYGSRLLVWNMYDPLKLPFPK